jgi:hypothetical protein
MTRHARAVAAAIALSACASPALAAATANARFDDFRITLLKLDAAGPDPSASFTTSGGSDAFVSFLDSSGKLIWSGSRYGGTAFAPTALSETNGGGLSGYAFLSGDAEGADGATIAAGVRVSGDAAGNLRSGYDGVLLGDGGPLMSFTLGTNTLLEVSAIATLSVSLASPSANEFEVADAAASLQVYGTGASASQSAASSLELTEFDNFGTIFGTEGTASQSMDLLFYGSNSTTTTGVFGGSLLTTSTSTMAVPEPTNAALLLAGLGALAMRRRQRTERRA